MQLFYFLQTLSLPVVGWVLSEHQSEWARKGARFTALLAVAHLLFIIISGFFHEWGNLGPIHKFAAHLLTIELWWTIPFSIGVALQRNFLSRPIFAIGQFIFFVGVFCLTLLASISGYLGPSHASYISVESYNRFRVVHFWVLPTLCILICTGWYLCFPAKRSINKDSSLSSDGQ